MTNPGGLCSLPRAESGVFADDELHDHDVQHDGYEPVADGGQQLGAEVEGRRQRNGVGKAHDAEEHRGEDDQPLSGGLSAPERRERGNNHQRDHRTGRAEHRVQKAQLRQHPVDVAARIAPVELEIRPGHIERGGGKEQQRAQCEAGQHEVPREHPDAFNSAPVPGAALARLVYALVPDIDPGLLAQGVPPGLFLTPDGAEVRLPLVPVVAAGGIGGQVPGLGYVVPGLYRTVKVVRIAAVRAQVRGDDYVHPAVRAFHDLPPPGRKAALFSVVFEVVLHDDDGRALVAAAAGEVAERADEVGEAPRRGALGDHVALEVGVLPADGLLDGGLELVAGEAGELVVGEVLELELVGQAAQALGEAGADDGVGQLPDLARRVLEGAVAVDHGLDLDAGALQQLGLDALGHGLGVLREELDLVLGGLVGAEQAVLRAVAAAVHGGVEDVAEGEHVPASGGEDAALGAAAGVDIAAEDVVRQRGGGLGAVGKDYLALRALLADDVLVVLDVVHAGEGVADGAEDAAVLGQRQHVGIGVDAAVVHRVLVKEVVADLIGGVGEHQHDLFAAAGYASQADGKAVPGKNGEHDGDGLAAQLGAHVGGNVVNRGVVAVGAGYDAFGDGDDVALVQLKALLGHCGLNSVGGELDYVVAFAYDRGTDAS